MPLLMRALGELDIEHQLLLQRSQQHKYLNYLMQT
jgi:hypothetical protein